MTRWEDVSPGGEQYAARFARLAASGAAVHGEADLVERLAPPGGRVLDAGCGTGRVAIRLREHGFAVDGVDVDADMLRVAAAAEPAITWAAADLALLGSTLPGPYDLVLVAGNVLPLLAAGTGPAAVEGLARRLDTGGLLVAGFGLDAAHLPIPAPTVTLADYDAWCADAGLILSDRFGTWDGEPYDGGGYAVSVHRAGGVHGTGGAHRAAR